MGNRRLYKIECFHPLGTSESERLKVTAINLCHPTASSLLQKVHFLILRHSLEGVGVRKGRKRNGDQRCNSKFTIFGEDEIRIDYRNRPSGPNGLFKR